MAFQELGMKAAMAVSEFNNLDRQKAGRLSFPELVRVFGEVNNVNLSQAQMIARTILGEDTDPNGGLTFQQFMTMTHGESITFDSKCC